MPSSHLPHAKLREQVKHFHVLFYVFSQIPKPPLNLTVLLLNNI